MTGPDTVRALPLSQIPLPFLDRATLPPKGNPGVAFDSTTLFGSTTLAGAVLPLHAEPIDHDGEGVLNQSEWSESFELVLPPSISTVNEWRRSWWTKFTGLDPRFSASQSAQHELEQGQEQKQEQLLVAGLSGATSPQVQVEPLDEHLQIDGVMVKAQAEMVCRVAEESQYPS